MEVNIDTIRQIGHKIGVGVNEKNEFRFCGSAASLRRERDRETWDGFY